MNLGNALKGKKVKIEEKYFSQFGGGTYKGTVEDLYVHGENVFIKLVEGKIINVRYIASIEIIE